MNMRLVYPACFYPDKEEGGYTVDFPDLLGCVTEGDTLDEAMEMAQDAASFWLYQAVGEKQELPKPSDIKDIQLEEDSFTSLIAIDLTEYAAKHSDKAVKKTLTIPTWLNTIAEAKGVNFSQALQNALMRELDLVDHRPRK